MMPKLLLLPFAGLFLLACGDTAVPPRQAEDNAAGHGPASAQTAARNAAVLDVLDFSDRQDFQDAMRGRIAGGESLVVPSANSEEVVWNQDAYRFLEGPAPDSVNPSLWRQAKLNAIHGLFEVSDRIYQLRGFDLANMTLIRGDSGWIVVDPLTTSETARAAWALAMQHLEPLPIRAILFTHSHVDHFGGVNGLVSPEQVKDEGIRVIAPAGFTEEATSENVLAGVAMQRRASYQYGRRLGRDARGHVGLGLGKEVPFGGQIGFLEPTEIIDRTPQQLTIDGVDFVFQNAPGSEAPAEFTFFLPQLNAYCGAEVVSRNLHNVYTLRGAKVRDALRWSHYIQEAIDLFAADTQVYFGSHQWPLWGQDEVLGFMRRQRDIYKFIHDQTLRLANAGYTPREIAEMISLPETLRQDFAVRGYYGTVKHNAKAVYQYYFGWYDANPANLDPLPPADSAERYIVAMGGADAVLNRGQQAFEQGEYRWAAELLNHLVFAEPDNVAARGLLARTYDQLGYQAESGPWRDVYLSGALELRHGLPEQGLSMLNSLGLLRAIPLDKFFDAMAVRLDAGKAEGKDLAVNFHFTDRNQAFHLWLENAVLHHQPYDGQPADVTMKLTHEMFLRMSIQAVGLRETIMSDELDIDGSRIDLVRFFGLFDRPDARFAIVTP